MGRLQFADDVLVCTAAWPVSVDRFEPGRGGRSSRCSELQVHYTVDVKPVLIVISCGVTVKHDTVQLLFAFQLAEIGESQSLNT